MENAAHPRQETLARKRADRLTAGAPTIAVERVACCVCGSSVATPIATGVDFEYATCDNVFEYVRCGECGHHYMQPRPAQSELDVIYPPHYGNYSNSVNPGLAFRVKALLERRALRRICADLPENPTVLDIGCGDGRLLENVRAVGPSGTQVEGIEISDRAAEGARIRGLEVRIGSIDAIGLPDESYDLISLIQVIEHVIDPVASIEKVQRALKPGGRVWFETPSTRCLDYALFKRRYWGGYHFPRHFNLFEPKNFAALLERHGFAVESIRHKVQPVHWVWTCHHWFKEHGWPAWWTESFNIRNPIFLGVFSIVDALQVAFLRRSSNMQIIARKPAPK